MTEDLQEVRTALQKRFGDKEKEIELLLRRYVGQHLTIRTGQLLRRLAQYRRSALNG